MLVGAYPPKALVHIRHVLFSFQPAPNGTGLLIGTIEQTKALADEAHQLQTSIAAQNPAGVRCAVAGMLDIIEGNKGTHFHPLATECANLAGVSAGDGYGLSKAGEYDQGGYLSNAEGHATLAATQSDSTAAMSTQAGLVVAALNHVDGVLTTLDADLLALQHDPTATTNISAIVALADSAYTAGTDASGAIAADANPRTAGALYAYDEGQRLANLTLAPPQH